MENIVYKDEAFAIVGAAIAVHKELGNGFLEAVYQESLEIELKNRGIPFVAQPRVNLVYKGIQLSNVYIPDLICYDKIIVELKAIEALTNKEEAQLLHYLKATQFQLGLLFNFGAQHRLEQIRRVL